MKCELCRKRDENHRVESDVGLWPTMVPMCDECYEKYQNGAEMEAIVRKL